MTKTEIFRIESISSLHKILGYEKPKHPLITLVNFENLDVDLIEIENYNKISLGFYAIYLKDSTDCAFKYGREYYDFEEGTLLFTAPNQILTFEETSEQLNPKGWALYFHPDFVRTSFLNDKIKDYTFFSYSANEALHVSDEERATITSVVKSIEHEYSINIDNYSHDVIVSNIELLLSYCKRFYGRQFITRKKQNVEIISKLDEILENYYKEEKQLLTGIPTVKYLADQLCLSASYLTDLIKQETGKNTQEHIHLFLIELAKNKLLCTNKTVSEIAYEIGFEYSQYFSKLFKSKTGQTPAEYRSLN